MSSSSFFEGLSFGVFNHLPRCAAQMDTRFQAFALNYAHAGHIYWAVGEEAPRELRGPVAFWMHPGPRFRYGAFEGESWDHHYISFRGRVRRGSL